MAPARKGGLLAHPPARKGSHEVCTPLEEATARGHVLAQLRRESVGQGAPLSGRETLLDKTLGSRFTMFRLLLFKLCDFSWVKRTAVVSSREVGV